MIRFSSFGDVTQCLSVPLAIASGIPGAQVHWVTRSDLAPLIQGHPSVRKIWILERKKGLSGLLRLALDLRQEKFDRIYDAHNNLRSRFISFALRFPYLPSKPNLLRRSIPRLKRFFLFRLRINLFRMPFSGQRDLLEPLAAWGISEAAPPAPQLFPSIATKAEATRLLIEAKITDFVALAPSAAHALKRWPLEHWKSLIGQSTENFVLLGGPEDTFLNDLIAVAPGRVVNFAGKCPHMVSAAIVAQAKALVTNDTGLLHVAEQQGIPAVALMGPAPFGFPSRETTSILQLDLTCRPCSKHGQGPCTNAKFHRCMVDLEPERALLELRRILGSRP